VDCGGVGGDKNMAAFQKGSKRMEGGYKRSRMHARGLAKRLLFRCVRRGSEEKKFRLWVAAANLKQEIRPIVSPPIFARV